MCEQPFEKEATTTAKGVRLTILANASTIILLFASLLAVIFAERYIKLKRKLAVTLAQRRGSLLFCVPLLNY